MGLAIARLCRLCARGSLIAGLAIWLAACLAHPALAAKPDNATAHDPAKLYLDADKLNYDKQNDVVMADGGVVLYYKNRVLQADHVVYDRKAKRVKANGRVKLTDERGGITYASRMDLTDDFASGFAEAVQGFPTNKTRVTAPRIERSDDSVTVFTKGVYTACEPCKAHPEWPPLWQIRAKEITEDQNTHTIYFRDAYFDAFGVPVAYLPYFSAPDPTVTRKSGFLSPTYVSNSYLGLGITTPYFFNLAPNYDLTLSPSFYTTQGPFLDVEWRHRLDNGSYSVRLSGIDQLQPGRFLAAPYGARNLDFRGSADSKGQLYLNKNWAVGWDLTLLSDRFYLNDYRLRTLDTSQYYFQDLVSQIYLRGQAGRGFFDLSVYSFQPLTAFLDSRQDPNAVPVFDFHRTFALDEEHWGKFGGEATVTLNVADVSRSEAIYQSIGQQRFDPAYGLYSVCATYAPGSAANNCLLRGIAGNYARGTEQVSWSKQIIDPLGEVWKPFAFERVSGQSTSLYGGSYTYTSATGSATIPNFAQPAFFAGQSTGSAAIGMAGAGLEYRYPFVMNSAFGNQVIEPIAQVIVRPNEVLPRLQPNEDAQSLVFDDTTLFEWSKYSGFDRVEGGTRANYGFHYAANFANGGHANIVAGQSVQLAGQNSYTIPDAANTGLDSGLDKRWSNVVAAETLQPTAAPFTIGFKQQFDPSNGALKRFDALATGKWGGWEGSIDFANYAAQPLLGWAFPRQGLVTRASYKLDNGFSFTGGVTLDLSRHYYDVNLNTPIYPAQYNVGLAYDANNCTTFKVAYNSTFVVPISTNPGVPAAPSVREQTVIFELDLRTLGDVKAASGIQ